MVQVDYYFVDTEYGEKLAVDFEYDEDLVDRIKRLREVDWETTHCSPVYEDDEFQYWTIDTDAASIARYENTTGETVPPKYKPDDMLEGGQVELVVPEQKPQWFYIPDASSEVDEILDAAFSYEVEDAEFTRAVQMGTWDGVEHLYDERSHSAPVGLLERAVELLEEAGYDVQVDYGPREIGSPAQFAFDFEHDLRPYQQEAVQAVLDQEGGIVGLPTGTGKTVVAMRLLSLLMRKSIVFVHTQELLYQWAEEVRDVLGVEPGLIGDDQWSEGDEITIAIMQTLDSRGTEDLDDDYGVVVFDECHRTSAAETFHEIGLAVDGHYRIGLSATPWRTTSGEELKIEGAIGGTAYTATAEEMIEQGYLAEPQFETVHPDDYGSPRRAQQHEDYHEAYERCIEFDPTRNYAVADVAAEMANDGRQVLVNVSRVSQAYILGAALNRHLTVDDVAEHSDPSKREYARACYDAMGTVSNLDARVLTSETPDSERKKMLEAFEEGVFNVLVSTLVKEGVDIPAINGIVLAHGQKSDIETIQVIGRALRANGGKATIVDVRDRGRFFGDAFQVRQNTMDTYYGSYGPDADDDARGPNTALDEFA